MEKREVIEFLKSENTYWDSRSISRPEVPFDLKPNKYLEFANIDILTVDNGFSECII